MTEDTAALPTSAPPPRRSSRGLVAVVASVAAVVLIAGGGFAAWQFLSGSGPRPADVLPDTTVALASVDVDPSGGQKVEAFRTLRKFPSWNERTGLTADSDVVKAIFEMAVEDSPCKDLDYEEDVKPWIGKRAGLGAVRLGDGEPAPVLALQVADADRAKDGFAALTTCAEVEKSEFGWTVTDDYVIASDSTAHAEAIAAAGEKSPLAEDAGFQKWTEEAGGAGIVNLYAGPRAAEVLTESFGEEIGELSREDADQLGKVLEDFRGAAAVLRFDGGGMEVSAAGGFGQAWRGGDGVSSHVATLPADTAALLAVAVPPGAMDSLADEEAQQGLDFLGAMTGLDLPEDLVTLLGTSFSLSLGGDAPADLGDLQAPGDVPVGALVRGDAAKIRAVIAKIERAGGFSLSDDLDATLASEDDAVALATSDGYAQELLGSGSLAGEKGFEDTVPNLDDAQSVAYADLDGAWAERLVDLLAEEDDPDAQEVAKNLRVLSAFGASTWTDGDVSHGLLRLSLD